MIGIAVLVVVMLWLIGAIVTLICAIVLGVQRSPLLAMSERNARRYVLTMPITWPRRLPRLMRAARSHVVQSSQQ